MIKMIVCLDKNNLIGNKNGLPWKNKTDLLFFKKQTINHYLLWGRKTYANLPRPLLNRKHYVVSKTINYFDDISKVLKSEKEVLKIIKEFENSDKTLWICGGKSIYQNYYKYAKEIFVSRLNNSYIGDTYLDLDFDLIKKNKDVLSKNQELTIYKYY